MSGAPILPVAQRLGFRGQRVSEVEWAGSCPRCGGKDRCGINTAKGIFSCRKCDVGGDAITLVRHVTGMSFAEALAFVGDERALDTAPCRFRDARWQSPPLTQAERVPDSEKIASALAPWRVAANPRKTVVEVYLNSRRLQLGEDLAGEVLRWHAGTGAMLALFRNIKTGEPQAISRTFLTPDGRKTSRKFLGPVGGAAIMLDAFDAVTQGLHIGEGVETCMSARQLDLKPCWALGSKGAIAAFPVLGGIKALTILEEPDAIAEAHACACRWSEAGREVFLNRAVGAKDLNDVLRGRA